MRAAAGYTIWLGGLLLGTGSLWAHGQADVRIARMTRLIETRGEDPALYARRGRAHSEVQHDRSAIADFERALELDPCYHEARYLLGLVYLRNGRLQEAERQLGRYVEEKPDAPGGLAAYARRMVALEDPLSAADYYDRAIRGERSPPPQLFLERARALMLAEPIPLTRIEDGLRDGLRIHGPIVTHFDMLVEASLAAGRPDRALHWIDQLPPGMGRSPVWLARRARILTRNGDGAAALEAWRALMRVLNGLPLHRRSTPAMTSLRQEALEAINATSNHERSTGKRDRRSLDR